MEVAGLLCRYINGWCCINKTHLSRIYLVTGTFISAFLVIAISAVNTHISFFFYLALISAACVGVGQSFAESVCLGFLKGFPSGVIGDFGGGTGFAGIFAVVQLLILRALKVHDTITFSIQVGSMLVF